MPQPIRKKLIEVALPLEAINIASAREKSIRHGHPSTLHLWWARRPLAACRAVLFASLVDDPSSLPEEFPTEAEQDAERQRLFRIIERLVLWENSNNPDVLNEAKAEILKSTGGNPPPVLDPFCGGGSIPLEAQRLGLEAHGSDLNPVAVLITKALIEIPPRFAGQPSVNPEARAKQDITTWSGAQGLAEDVRYYGKWMRDEAEKRIGRLYPKAQLPEGGEATVIAWIWARTVKCPNPACGCQMPLVRSFALSTKAGKAAWAEPVIDDVAKTIRFVVKTGAGTPREATVGKRGAVCICCESPVPLDHVRAEGRAKRMGAQLMAIVAEGKKGRIYLAPTPEHEATAAQAEPEWMPETELAEDPRNIWCVNYGLTTHSDLFTKRQLVALTTFSDLVGEAREKVAQDGFGAGLTTEQATIYADAVATYLAFVLDKLADLANSLNRWEPIAQCPRNLFSRQAIPMVWDIAEGNPIGESSGSWTTCLSNEVSGLLSQPMRLVAIKPGSATNVEAEASIPNAQDFMFSTDPPYYDNISYANLSDFFYIWLRHSLMSIYPDIFRTMLVPKTKELIADPFRQGGKEESRHFFEDGIKRVFGCMRHSTHPDYPVSIFYAFKQSETEEGDESKDESVSSTGWETFLQGLIDAGFQTTATWPMRTENASRMRGQNSNALASSIVLACRPRPEEAPIATRREFVNALRRELEEALLHMMHGNIAPVDLAQATIGPGMAVYSRYSKVIETDGKPLRVRAALQIINQELATILSADEGDYDGDTRFCLTWFEQYGQNTGAFGEADVLARAKGTSVQGLAEAGVLEAKAGKVRLFKRDELPADWNPQTDERVPVWECAQQLVRALLEQGEGGAARLCAALGAKAEPARDLAYRLYSLCERKGWAQEALAYNSLVISWSEITRIASSPNIAPPDATLFAEGEV